MNFDRNTIIGFVLLMLLLFGFMFISERQRAEFAKQKQKEADSIAAVKKAKQRLQDSAAALLPTINADTVQNADTLAGVQSVLAPEQLTVVENKRIKVTFTNKGAYPRSVELKDYRRWDGSSVVLGGPQHLLVYDINIGNNAATSTENLSFGTPEITRNGDVQLVRYSLVQANGTNIVHEFTIRDDEYLMDWNLKLNGTDRLFTQGILNIQWNILANQQEGDLKYEKGQSNLAWNENNAYDFTQAGTGGSEKLGDKTKWVGVKQQFFNTTMLAKNNFSYAASSWTVPAEDDTANRYVMDVKSQLRFELKGLSSATVPMQLYFGPNDYHILSKYDNLLASHVQLGYGIFAFVKYINRYIVMPVFDFFSKYVGSLGIVILLLTFFIRLIISPLTYSSYLSGAKMKMLRPEIEELKKKFGSDQQAMSMEQMKLFRQAGVNPLGGCIPALLQIPIFFALYSFFNASIGLRGESFLWAHDLSAYDSIAQLPFEIPFYGSHVSLFTITATATSFLISVYNMQMTPTQDNPVYKYMIYFFPLMLLFIFNSLPSALTWYYTVSNLVTLGLQLIIQKLIIDEKKIHAQIQENKKKPVTKSKWQERLEQMQASNQRVQDLQKKTQKGK